MLEEEFANFFLGGFIGTVRYHILLFVIVLSGIIDTPWIWFVHIRKLAKIVLIWTIEVATAIVMAEPSIVSLSVANAKVNPHLTNYGPTHKSQIYATLFVDFP